MGERVLWKDLTADHLYNQILKIIETPKYRETAKITSKLFRDQKETPMERALWWIDWILRNPNTNHIRSLGGDLNFFQLQSLDVILVIIFGTFGLLWFVGKCISKLL